MQTTGIQVEVVMTVNEEVFSKELGQRIARFRKEQGLTQQQLADALRLKQYAVASYEIGRYRVPVALLPELARVLSVPVDDLLGTPLPKSKRGPAPMVQRQLEKIQALPKDKQKFVLQALDMALKTT
jgi:transcriptional regulator with XRE-family HTH domain